MSKTRTKKVFRWIFAVLAVFYVLFVIKITFVKDGVRLETQMRRLIPFNGIYDYRLGLKSAVSLAINYLGNVAMFFPAGIFLPVVFKKLNIKKTVKDGNAVIAPEGRLDTITAPELEAAIKKTLPGTTYLTLDLKNLEYISSAGLRVLLSAQKAMNAQGEMKVCNVNDTIMEIFEVTGFCDVLTIE